MTDSLVFVSTRNRVAIFPPGLISLAKCGGEIRIDEKGKSMEACVLHSVESRLPGRAMNKSALSPFATQ